MILGVENTKEDMYGIEAKKWCPICGEHYAPGHGEYECSGPDPSLS